MGCGLDAVDRMVLRGYLRHKIDITPSTGTDGESAPVYNATAKKTAVRCFIQENRPRVANTGEVIEVPDWRVSFAPDASVDMNWLLENGEDKQGEAILPKGTVARVNKVRHVDFLGGRGPLLVQVDVYRA